MICTFVHDLSQIYATFSNFFRHSVPFWQNLGYGLKLDPSGNTQEWGINALKRQTFSIALSPSFSTLYFLL